MATYHETTDAAFLLARQVEQDHPEVEGDPNFLRIRRALAQMLVLTWDWETGRGEFGTDGHEAAIALECGERLRAAALREMTGETAIS